MGAATNVDAKGSVQFASSARRSVQSHIDETPLWRDDTSVRATPTTGMQWLIGTLAATGKFFEGMVVFMTGVALPGAGIRARQDGAWRRRRGESARDSGGRDWAWRAPGHIRPQAHVRGLDVHLPSVSRSPRRESELSLLVFFLFGLGWRSAAMIRQRM